MNALDNKLNNLESGLRISFQEKISKYQESLGESIAGNVQRLRSEIEENVHSI
jgi:hypothetical protein